MPELPIQLLNSLKSLAEFDETGFVKAHAGESNLTSIRLNPFKFTTLDFELNKPVPWSENGFYLDERPSFTLDPLFQAGTYYVQEAGSMFLEHVLRSTLNFNETLRILDSCAAPGGKSTLINSLLNENSLLVSNELIKSRAEVLVQNLSKWGTANTIVCNGETQKFKEIQDFFDAIIVDAPCSGSGLFRKQPEAILEWSESHVKSCSVRQEKIVTDLIPALKENGILFYSTCSYSVEENEDIVSKLIKEHNLEFVEIPIHADWGLVKSNLGYRFYPNLTLSEGFFCAVLQKKKQENLATTHRNKKNNKDITTKETNFLKEFIDPLENTFAQINNRFHLMNIEVLNFINTFEGLLYFKKAGLVVGEIKGHDLVPHQELAWHFRQSSNLNVIELTKENALKYLRKENLSHTFATKGLVLFTYKGHGLGWAKILPNRINNYFPNELRILIN